MLAGGAIQKDVWSMFFESTLKEPFALSLSKGRAVQILTQPQLFYGSRSLWLHASTGSARTGFFQGHASNLF